VVAASTADDCADSATEGSPWSTSARFHHIRKVSVAAAIVLIVLFQGWREERGNESAEEALPHGEVTSAGTGGFTSPSTPTTATAPRDSPTSPTDDAFFVAVANANNVQYSSQAEIIALGHAICSQIDGGVDPYMLSSRFVSNAEWTPVAAGAIVGTAVAVYCPEHGHLI
jgi:hypothetical protein